MPTLCGLPAATRAEVLTTTAADNGEPHAGTVAVAVKSDSPPGWIDSDAWPRP